MKQDRDKKGKFLSTHGVWCKHFRKRYTDARTREGKQLKAVMDSLVELFAERKAELAGKAA